MATTERRSLSIPAHEIEVEYARSGGPGGQHVNKTETKVTLRWDVGASSISEVVKAKLLKRLATRLTKSGELLVSCDTHRERPRNQELARERLQEFVDAALVEKKKRMMTKPSRGAKARRLSEKKRTSEKKQTRGRVRDD